MVVIQTFISVDGKHFTIEIMIKGFQINKLILQKEYLFICYTLCMCVLVSFYSPSMHVVFPPIWF